MTALEVKCDEMLQEAHTAIHKCLNETHALLLEANLDYETPRKLARKHSEQDLKIVWHIAHIIAVCSKDSGAEPTAQAYKERCRDLYKALAEYRSCKAKHCHHRQHGVNMTDDEMIKYILKLWDGKLSVFCHGLLSQAAEKWQRSLNVKFETSIDSKKFSS